MPSSESKVPPAFLGRELQLQWMERIFLAHRSWYRPFVINGLPGSGKTTFVQEFLKRTNLEADSRWFTISSPESVNIALKEVHDIFTRRFRRDVPHIIIFDNLESIPSGESQVLFDRTRNFKSVHAVILISRSELNIEGANVLTLEPLSDQETESLLRQQLSSRLSPDELTQAVQLVGGSPIMARILAKLIESAGQEQLQGILRGQLYQLGGPQSLIIPADVKLQIISTSDELVAKIRKQPESIYKLPPRKFEELLADLLSDMGADVELTPETRDGGCDILAKINTDFGRMLCLVEAKRYAKTRKVGIELIRNLMFVMSQKKANSAMMVTTAKFTKGVRQFQKDYEWQLQLRDFEDVVGWINGYKTGKRSPFAK